MPPKWSTPVQSARYGSECLSLGHGSPEFCLEQQRARRLIGFLNIWSHVWLHHHTQYTVQSILKTTPHSLSCKFLIHGKQLRVNMRDNCLSQLASCQPPIRATDPKAHWRNARQDTGGSFDISSPGTFKSAEGWGWGVGWSKQYTHAYHV